MSRQVPWPGPQPLQPLRTMPLTPRQPAHDADVDRIDWAEQPRHVPGDQTDGPAEDPADGPVEQPAERPPIEQMEIEEPNQEFHREYLQGIKRHVTLTCLIVATFLLMLDTSVIATAVPSITDQFNSISDIGWYSGVYQLTSAVFQPLTGKIYQRLPLKMTYLVCFTIFTLGSLLSGSAPSSAWFIVGRAVAGLGGAGVTTGALTIVSTIAPVQEANELVGFVMSFSHFGMVMGPIVGGLFSEYVTWRWCFWINLPIGAVIIPALFIIRIPEQVQKEPATAVLKSIHKHLDLIGFALFTPFTIQLLLALQFGSSGQHAWNSTVVIALFSSAGVFLIAWAIWTHHRGRDAIIPMYILKPRVVWASTITQCLLMTAVYVVTVYLSMYFQAIKGMTPMNAGLNLLAGILTQLFVTIVSGSRVVRTGLVGVFASTAGLFTVGSSIAYAHLHVDSKQSEYLGYQILNGIGRGLGMQSQYTAINFSLGPGETAVAMAVLMCAQFLVTAIAQVTASVVFLETLASGLASRVPAETVAAIIQAGARNFRDLVAPGDLDLVLEVYLRAIQSTFWLICAIGGLATASGLMMGRVKAPPEAIEALGPDLRGR